MVGKVPASQAPGLSFILRTHGKLSALPAHKYDPELGSLRQENSRGSQANESSLIEELQASNKPCLKEHGWCRGLNDNGPQRGKYLNTDPQLLEPLRRTRSCGLDGGGVVLPDH